MDEEEQQSFPELTEAWRPLLQLSQTWAPLQRLDYELVKLERNTLQFSRQLEATRSRVQLDALEISSGVLRHLLNEKFRQKKNTDELGQKSGAANAAARHDSFVQYWADNLPDGLRVSLDWEAEGLGVLRAHYLAQCKEKDEKPHLDKETGLPYGYGDRALSKAVNEHISTIIAHYKNHPPADDVVSPEWLAEASRTLIAEHTKNNPSIQNPAGFGTGKVSFVVTRHIRKQQKK